MFKKYLENCTEFIRAGANVNKQDQAGNTALIISVNSEEDDCMKELIKSGADLNIRNRNGLDSNIQCLGARELLPDFVGSWS